MESRRKRLLFRCQHTGMKENDTLLGAFAEARIHDLDVDMLDALEALLEGDDINIFKWVTKKLPAPDNIDPKILQMIRDFNDAGHHLD